MKRSPSVHRWILAAFAALAFLGCLVLLSVPGTYVSPDETANAFFARTFAERGTLAVFEPLNAVLDERIHPRSVISLDSRLVPGSFVGLPVLYGTLGALFGHWSVPFYTPLIAALAVCAWYAVVRRVFDRDVALLSAVLLAIHPAWWYYSARSLMHNVLFTSFLIVAAYFAVARPGKGTRWGDLDFVVSGALTGIALFVRTSEAVWLALAIACALLPLWKRIAWRKAVLFAGSALIALLPLLFLNNVTYGGPLTFGYNARAEAFVEAPGVSADEALAESSSAAAVSPVSTAFGMLFPFGLSWKDTAKNVAHYGIGLFWWMSALAAVGLALAFPTRATPSEARPWQRSYLAFAGAATLYLGFLYGSWTFFDNPDPTQITIGNSHVRYWLPVFVLSTPLAALAIRWISRRALTDAARRFATVALVGLCVGLSVRVAFFSPQDGIVTAAQGLLASREIRDHVVANTEPDAVIIVDRADKIFFPYRRVTYPLRDEATYALMPRIVLRVPLYYYGITLPPVDVAYLNDEKLAGLGLRIDEVGTFGIETLYRITKRP